MNARRIVGPTDEPVSPQHQCGGCEAEYFNAEAAAECCSARLRADGGTERPPFVDPHAETVKCHFCSRTWDPVVVDGFDLSAEDEYYPKMVPVCPEHAGGCR
ncbi:hypothetical protein [Halosimplex pelagicum]|uniref:Uncharacterized protein n=1 Tax=Halosimplex pelagicum TaxID=869886 RepID=A0A7D5TUH0_9EURY|nr:hypothetical protein [Halosimplex pelagicum]QLH83232.1 hypothetical protein HZS54_17050 [Halosimplex pelagicum]